jgi:hypothetical protein
MIEIVSLVNFDNPKRVQYLEKSFGSIHKYNSKNIVHHVFDSSQSTELQSIYYRKLGIELHHMPGSSYNERLQCIKDVVSSDFIVFLPDDYVWIFDFPIEAAISQARQYGVSQIKLSCRGMSWFAQENPTPKAWFKGNQVESGERLHEQGALFISKRRWFRNFHEQFSLGCTISSVEFLDHVAQRIRSPLFSPGACEKRAYLILVFYRYYTAYYKMQCTAFHFADYGVEGKRTEHTLEDMLIEENYSVYNSLYNGIEDSR